MEETAEAYGGLPIPTYSEWEFLQGEVDKVMADEPNLLEQIYEAVLAESQYLQDVIDHDVETFQSYEANENLSFGELAEYGQGMRMGYSLIVGSFTYMYFMRSGQTNFDEYMLTAPTRNGELPVMSEREVRRAKAVRLGKACVDVVFRDLVDDSSELADLDLANYLNEAIRLEDLIESSLTQQLMEFVGAHINSGSDQAEDERPYEAGFHHGVANAVEMYIQSREEQLFTRIEKAA